MHQLSNIQKINVKIDLEVHVADMTKNKLENKILHTKLWSTHISNPLQYGCVTENKKQQPFCYCMHQLSSILKINVKINLEVIVADMTKTN